MWKWLIIYLSLASQVYAQEATQSNAELNVEQDAQNVMAEGTITPTSDFQNNSSANNSEPAVIKQKSMVYVKKIKSPLNTVYKKVFTSLDNNGYFVVFEPNIGRNLAHFEKRWGDDYNRNKLESIRSMVFCNGWYANKVSNADPNMMALCPLHITLIHKKGVTSILFVRPGSVAVNSPAEEIAIELEQDVIRSIEEALVR